MTILKRLTVGVRLRLLFGALLLVLVAALAVPTWSAIEQRSEAIKVVAVARAGQDVFNALQYLRPERGSVQAALGAPAPADAALLESLAALRGKAAPALDAVLRDCSALRCAADDPQLDAFRRGVERLLAVRRDADAALRQPLAGRPPGLAATWTTTISEVTNRLDRSPCRGRRTRRRVKRPPRPMPTERRLP